MVQFTQERLRAGGNDYWKLTNGRFLTCANLRERLEGKGFRPRSKVRKAGLVKMYHRAIQGFVHFERCNKKQLKQFCDQRDLQITTVDQERNDLIEALEKADEEQTFYRFADLPPELRAQIFELHFQSFGVLVGPKVPPVAQISRLFRQESLSLFYKTCTFAIDVNKDGGWVRLSNGEGDFERFASEATSDFIDHTDSVHLDMIRKISLEGDIFSLPRGNHPRAPSRTWLINFAGTGARRVARGCGWRLIISTRAKCVAKRLLQEIEQISETSNDGKSKFERLLAMLEDVEIDLRA